MYLAFGWFFPCNTTDKCKILTFSLQNIWWLNFDSSSRYAVDSTLTHMTINVIRPWLDTHPWFSRPTQLWLDSFESESSQIWLTTHESSTTPYMTDTSEMPLGSQTWLGARGLSQTYSLKRMIHGCSGCDYTAPTIQGVSENTDTFVFGFWGT